jgi:hypothetical protein
MAEASDVRFDPERLERLRVQQDYPMEEEEFNLLYHHNAYCSMAHVNKRGYPVVSPMFYFIGKNDNIMMSTIKNYRLKVGFLM